MRGCQRRRRTSRASPTSSSRDKRPRAERRAGLPGVLDTCSPAPPVRRGGGTVGHCIWRRRRPRTIIHASRGARASRTWLARADAVAHVVQAVEHRPDDDVYARPAEKPPAGAVSNVTRSASASLARAGSLRSSLRGHRNRRRLSVGTILVPSGRRRPCTSTRRRRPARRTSSFDEDAVERRQPGAGSRRGRVVAQVGQGARSPRGRRGRGRLEAVAVADGLGSVRAAVEHGEPSASEEAAGGAGLDSSVNASLLRRQARARVDVVDLERPPPPGR